jgi:hypothetical protein
MIPEEGSQDDLQLAYANALKIKKIHEASLMAKPNVIGVGIGLVSGAVALVVLVQRPPEKPKRTKDQIPVEIEGIPVEIRVVGEVKANNSFLERP